VTRSIHGLALLLVLVLGAAGCVTSRAQVPEQPPSLVVPPVPPRAIEPPPPADPPAAPAPAEPPPAPAPAVRARPRPQADVKPDQKQEPPTETVAAAPNPLPVAPLRTPMTPTGPEAARQIREILDNTLKTLDKVEPPLSDDRKANLTSARNFIQQAEEALKKEELTQARALAERAQNIAKLLQSGR
jgi:type IV secretory pathway VirB10-like protein